MFHFPVGKLSKSKVQSLRSKAYRPRSNREPSGAMSRVGRGLAGQVRIGRVDAPYVVVCCRRRLVQLAVQRLTAFACRVGAGERAGAGNGTASR